MAERYKLTPEEKRERFNEYHRKYYQQNRERILAYRREWEETNPKSAEYAEKHREYLKKYNRNYYLAHCDEIAERRRLQRRETMKHKRSMKEKAALFDLLMDRGCISEEFVRVLEEQAYRLVVLKKHVTAIKLAPMDYTGRFIQTKQTMKLKKYWMFLNKRKKTYTRKGAYQEKEKEQKNITNQ